ncbi:uncharacterized protein [Ptychodera flava]|uniref:uncharacterized protein n=1 Tax=Ptychodera flava TaxID=63121 RepID=UPI00396A4B54
MNMNMFFSFIFIGLVLSGSLAVTETNKVYRVFEEPKESLDAADRSCAFKGGKLAHIPDENSEAADDVTTTFRFSGTCAGLDFWYDDSGFPLTRMSRVDTGKQYFDVDSLVGKIYDEERCGIIRNNDGSESTFSTDYCSRRRGYVCEFVFYDPQELIASTFCDEGWIFFRGSCYLLKAQSRTWFTAQRTCSTLYAASLPQPGSVQANDIDEIVNLAMWNELDTQSSLKYEFWVGRRKSQGCGDADRDGMRVQLLPQAPGARGGCFRPSGVVGYGPSRIPRYRLARCFSSLPFVCVKVNTDMEMHGPTGLSQSRYKAYSEPRLSWHGAIRACSKKGGRLADIYNDENHRKVEEELNAMGRGQALEFWFDAISVGGGY